MRTELLRNELTYRCWGRTGSAVDRQWFLMAGVATRGPCLLHRFEARDDRVGLFGHSMGGRGALTLAFNNPGRFQSVSAFAKIAAPMQCPWGVKAFTSDLGQDRPAGAGHDATALVKSGARVPPLLIDQGAGAEPTDGPVHGRRRSAHAQQRCGGER